MKRLLILLTIILTHSTMYARRYEVSGPQGGLSMTVNLPEGFDIKSDTCPMVILMHGIFSSKRITPLPTIAKSLAKAGIASIRFNFGGHWSSEGKMERMTIENEIADALAMWEYACSLPYVSKIGLLGHSQGGVVASMTAGRLAERTSITKPLYGLVLIAPASVLKQACKHGGLLGAKFDPVNPPEIVKCFGVMKISREYILSTQQLEIYETAKNYNGPVRIIHGDQDKLVPMWCSEDYKRTYGEASELIVVKGENHRISKKTKEVAGLLVDFFTSSQYPKQQ